MPDPLRSPETDALEHLTRKLRQFTDEREWGQFHTPKNLAMALAAEAGELLEIFQWLTDDEAQLVMTDPGRASAVRDELADVFAYLIRLADVAGVDLSDALTDKIAKNDLRYPVDRARGSAEKYTEWGSE